MKKYMIIVFLCFFASSLSATFKCRTNLLGDVVGIPNAGFEYLLNDTWSIEGNFWRASFEGNFFFDYEYDYTKYGVLVRKYLSHNFYVGAGVALLDVSTSFVGVELDSSFYGLELKAGKDFNVYNNLDMGMSIGYFLNFSEDYMTDDGEIESLNFFTLGFNAAYTF